MSSRTRKPFGRSRPTLEGLETRDLPSAGVPAAPQVTVFAYALATQALTQQLITGALVAQGQSAFEIPLDDFQVGPVPGIPGLADRILALETAVVQAALRGEVPLGAGFPFVFPGGSPTAITWPFTPAASDPTSTLTAGSESHTQAQPTATWEPAGANLALAAGVPFLFVTVPVSAFPTVPGTQADGQPWPDPDAPVVEGFLSFLVFQDPKTLQQSIPPARTSDGQVQDDRKIVPPAGKTEGEPPAPEAPTGQTTSDSPLLSVPASTSSASAPGSATQPTSSPPAVTTPAGTASAPSGNRAEKSAARQTPPASADTLAAPADTQPTAPQSQPAAPPSTTAAPRKVSGHPAQESDAPGSTLPIPVVLAWSHSPAPPWAGLSLPPLALVLGAEICLPAGVLTASRGAGAGSTDPDPPSGGSTASAPTDWPLSGEEAERLLLPPTELVPEPLLSPARLGLLARMPALDLAGVEESLAGLVRDVENLGEHLQDGLFSNSRLGLGLASLAVAGLAGEVVRRRLARLRRSGEGASPEDVSSWKFFVGCAGAEGER